MKNQTSRHWVFLHPSDELYGADRMLIEIVGAMDPADHLEVWVPTDLAHPENALCDELTRRGIPVRHVDLPIMRRAYKNPRGASSLVGRSRRLVRELRARRPDVVYCTTSAAFIGAPLARLAQVPLVIGHVQEIWSRSDLRVLGLFARSCHTLVAISDAVAEALSPRLRERTRVVLNGTPEPRDLVPVSQRSGPLHFLVASRWNGWKGHGTLLEAWELAGAPGHLTILGGPPPSGESVDVPALVDRLSRPSSVSIPGQVADTSTYIEQADVVLMPSDDPEPFGLVAIEAFARGRPVVASAAGGLLDIVVPDVDGWLFPRHDAAALAHTLSQLTRDSVGAAGIQARLHYEREFTAVHFSERWRNAVLA